MSIISTPVSGRTRFTYFDNLPDMHLRGIVPTVTATQLAGLVSGLTMIQSSSIRDVFITVESDLTEA